MLRPRILLIGFAGFLALAILAVWQVPGWLDWTRYRATIEVLASATLGQQVTIRGPITLMLLPQPILTAAQVSVGSDDDPAGFSISVAALRLRVALWPLLGGHVDARELVLRGPDLHIPWPDGSGVLQARPPGWLAYFAARIENGRLTIGRLDFTGIDATLATLETGALSATGTAEFSGQNWHFTARLTAAGLDGAAGLNVTLDGQGKANGLGASFTGQLAADGTLAGAISSRGPSLAVLLPAPPVPFRADGRLTVGGGLAVADDLALEIGGSPATGAVALRVAPQQRLDIAVTASRLDLDAWLPMLLRSGSTVGGISVPVGIDLSAEAAPFAGGMLQHLRAGFDLADNDLLVREASALLPGNARLALSGRIIRSDPTRARFEGDAKLDAPVARTTLQWLHDAGLQPAAFPVSLPDGVLQHAQISARVAAGIDETRLDSIAGRMDDAAVSGLLVFKRGEPPSVVADLVMDRLPLDAWVPAQLSSAAEFLRPTTRVDAGVRIKVREATLWGVPIIGALMDMAIDAGTVRLRRIEGTAEGVQVLASGILGGNGRVSDGILSLSTLDATPLAALLPAARRATAAFWHGPARLDLQAGGPPEALTVRTRLAMADARLEAQPTIDLRSGEWSGPVTLRHPGARRLIATLGLPELLGLSGPPAWLDDGSLSLVARISGSPGRLAADSFDLSAGGLRAGGKLMLDRAGGEPRLTGRLSMETLPLYLPSGVSDAPLPLAALAGWQAQLRLEAAQLLGGSRLVLRDAATLLSLTGGKLRLDQISGRLGGGMLSGSCAFDSTASPPSLSVQARVVDAAVAGPLADLALDLLSGRANASVDLAATGYSPSALLATITGQASLIVSDGVLVGFDLFRVKQAAAKSNLAMAEAAAIEGLMSGTTAFDRLDMSATIAHGGVSLADSRLTGAAGQASFSGGVGLATDAADLRATLHPAVPEPPEIALRFNGPIQHPTRTPELVGLARWLAERAQ